MNKNLKNIISTIIFIFLLSISIYKCSDLLEYKAARKKYDDFFSSKVNFDVILMGTSHMYNSILPMELWKDYGISSYNWGYANCTLAEDYYLLPEILKHTKPKLVVIDMYGLVEYEKYDNKKYRTDKIEQQHIQFDSIPISINKINAIFDVFDDSSRKEEFLWNFISYHNRWNELSEEDFSYNVSKEMGASFLEHVSTNPPKLELKAGTTKIDSVLLEYLIKIFDYCEKNNIEVLCVYIPFAASSYNQMVANSIPQILVNYNNVKYVNLFDKEIVDFNTDLYKDNHHLNFSGAAKITDWLGEYIKDNYNIPNTSKSKWWKQKFEEYKKFKIEKIKSNLSIYDVLMLIADKNYNIIIEIKNNNLLNDEINLKLLKNLGIDIDSINDTTHFLISNRNGKLNYVIDEFHNGEEKKYKLDNGDIIIKKINDYYNIYVNNSEKSILYDDSNKNNIQITIIDADTFDLLGTINL